MLHLECNEVLAGRLRSNEFSRDEKDVEVNVAVANSLAVYGLTAFAQED